MFGKQPPTKKDNDEDDEWDDEDDEWDDEDDEWDDEEYNTWANDAQDEERWN